MKKTFLFAILIMSLLLCACTTPNERQVVSEIQDEKLVLISHDRMNDLVQINNVVVDTMYGNFHHSSLMELKSVCEKYYTKDVIVKYFENGIFYDDNNHLDCVINVTNRKNIAKMNCSINYDSILLKNDMQEFTVIFSDEVDTYRAVFVVTFNNEISNWVLTDIVL